MVIDVVGASTVCPHMCGTFNPFAQPQPISPEPNQEQSVTELLRSMQELGDRLQRRHQREVNRLAGLLQDACLEAQHLRFLLESSVKSPLVIPKTGPRLGSLPSPQRPPLDLSPVPSPEEQLSGGVDESASVFRSGNNVFVVKLRVSIVSSWGLRNADFGLGQGTSDPYCICQPIGKPGQGIKTKVEPDTLHPVWNHEGFIPTFGESDDLEFCVYDSDYLKDDDLLGRVVLKGRLLVAGGFEGDLKLEDTGLDDEDGAYLRVKVSPIKEDDTVFMARLQRAKSQWPQLVKNIEGTEGRKETAQLHRKCRLTGHHRIRRTVRCGDATSTKTFQEDKGFVTRALQTLVVSPGVRKRIFWDMMGFSLVAYDVFMIPFMQVFDLDMTTPFLMIAIIMALYWSLDVIGTFFTGYLEQGVIEMRFYFIARRYFQSWFLFDITFILIDWLFIISTIMLLSEAGVGLSIKLLRILRSARAVRTLRMLSLLRLAKAKHVMSYILRMTREPVTRALFRLAEAMMVLLTMSHFVCCLWCWLGRREEDEVTWMKARHYQSESISWQYGTALHWVITQYTPSSMDVQPSNIQERYFTLLIDISGFVVFSTFVSTITTNMTQVRALKQQKSLNSHQLRLYFQEHKVSLELARRIMSYLQPGKGSLWVGHTHMSELAQLKGLTPELLHDLKLEVFSPIVLQHPFFYAADSITRDMLPRVCNTVVTEMSWDPDDRVFEQGQVGTSIYFVVAGTLSYLWVGGALELAKGSWIAEPALWIEDWEYRGSLKADKPCEGVKIDVSTLLQILKELSTPAHSPELETFVQMYASTFVRFNSHGIADAPSLQYTDVWVDAEQLKMTVEHELLPCV